MALADDLLSQARILVTLDKTRPKQASLRRAVSTAYYALFHLMLGACIQRFSPTQPAALGPRIARALAHAEMKEVCLPISRSAPGAIFATLVPSGPSIELTRLAAAFILLQEARHLADYDLAAAYSRAEVSMLIDRTEQAFTDWKLIQASEEASVFLSALLFARRWAK